MSIECEVMFKDSVAWFSNSVSKKRKEIWKNLGGKESDFETAQFIFSENAESTDTKEIFQSAPYRNELLAVFHARYISDCSKAKRKQDIPIGKYFLPPTEIQSLVRKQMKYIWDDDDSGFSGDEESVLNNDKKRRQESSIKSISQTMKSDENNRRAEDVHDVAEGSRQNRKSEPRNNISRSSDRTEKRKSIAKSPVSPKKKGKSVLPTEEQSCVELNNVSLKSIKNQRQSHLKSPCQSERDSIEAESNLLLPDSLRQNHTKNNKGKNHGNKPVNSSCSNGLSNKNLTEIDKDFLLIVDLPKVTSEIEDLVPGKNGFEVLMKK